MFMFGACFASNSVSAHEIRPAIANVSVSDTRVDIDILLSLEPLVAGINLALVNDTNDSPLAQEYDDLRAKTTTGLAEEFQTVWPDIASGIRLRAGEKTLALVLENIEVVNEPDLDLPRESLLRISATLPANDSAVTLGWSPSYGPLVVRQVLAEGGGYAGYLAAGEDSEPIPRTGSAEQPWAAAFLDYIVIGFEHIVPKGLDHILFVLGLFFFSLKLRPLLYQVSAFTVAHTVSLALAILGYVQISAAIVEPLIAASIVYVAVENILMTRYRPWRTAVVFGFGLLHGLGFASVLGDIGLNPARFITGLIGFNIGVELGQLTVIVAAFFSVGYWFGKADWYRSVIAVPASTAIAIIGAYWFIERVFL
jgi:hypothetical protein